MQLPSVHATVTVQPPSPMEKHVFDFSGASPTPDPPPPLCQIATVSVTVSRLMPHTTVTYAVTLPGVLLGPWRLRVQFAVSAFAGLVGVLPPLPPHELLSASAVEAVPVLHPEQPETALANVAVPSTSAAASISGIRRLRIAGPSWVEANRGAGEAARREPVPTCQG